jgi:hypothetical protein
VRGRKIDVQRVCVVGDYCGVMLSGCVRGSISLWDTSLSTSSGKLSGCSAST